jgi:hypothetical protein
MVCSYDFVLPVDPLPVMELAKQAIIEGGGKVTGRIPDVYISMPSPFGLFEGTCTLVDGTTINLTVTRKPDIVPSSLLRERLVLYLKEAVRRHRQAVEAVPR